MTRTQQYCALKAKRARLKRRYRKAPKSKSHGATDGIRLRLQETTTAMLMLEVVKVA